MLFSLKTFLYLVCGVSLCLAVGVNTHPIFALPTTVIVMWSMVSAYHPEFSAEYEMEALYGIVLSVAAAIVVYAGS
ncbi:hypothetical protein [Blastopirellula marina]|uniref:Uncharacterized protein n=1 Tax=Blastopirellula marina TaxID=124 RepID=A0A2S8GKY6_9BACT|nr:hypothetical protein [Blastopirellula marina]PQO45060.1 hypothetical protein C5Y93_16125 [Blastopirellula marina]